MTGGAGRRLLMIEQGGRGGVADYTAELSAALAAEGWRVTLATAADHRYSPDRGRHDLTDLPLHPWRLAARPPPARARSWASRCNALRFLAAIPRLMGLAAHADIVHTQGWESPLIGLPAVACLRLTGHAGGADRARSLRTHELASAHAPASAPARGRG